MRFPLLTLCLASAATAAAAQQPMSWTAETIQWQETYEDGTRYAVLEGRRDVPGQAFTYAFFIPRGYWEHHWHSSDARIVVLSGALRVAYGERLDRDHAAALPPGTFALVPANVQHTMGADEDTIVIGTAVGPWATHRHEGH